MRRFFGLRPRASDDSTERARERTRAQIANALIRALVVVVAATFLYMASLSVGGLPTEDIINMMQSVGTTLLAPLVGLIGAVIGFYYGGQTAASVATETAAATKKATKQATDAAVRTTDAAAKIASATK